MKKLILPILIIILCTAVLAEETTTKATQVITLSDGKVALCVNCPTVTSLGSGDKQLICKDQTCELYFGFEKTLRDLGQENEKYYTYTNSETSTEEFIIKKETDDKGVIKTPNQNAIGEGFSHPSGSSLSLSKMPYGREAILAEITDKAIQLGLESNAAGIQQGLESQYYKLTAENTQYALLHDVIITLDKTNGEILEIKGISKEPTEQVFKTLINEPRTIIVKLSQTELLNFRGLNSRKKYDLISPILVINNPLVKLNEKKSLEQQDQKAWLELLENSKKKTTGEWTLNRCGETMPYYAPGSKFQLEAPVEEKEGCYISDYVLSTWKHESNLQKEYACRSIKYKSKPGKLKELTCAFLPPVEDGEYGLYCDTSSSCKESEMSLVIDDTGNEVELGTNDFIKDSRFKQVVIGDDSEPSTFKIISEEIKVGEDYVFPQDSQAEVVPVEFIGPLHAGLKVKTGTTVIRAWSDKNVLHTIKEDSDGNPVNYVLSIFHASNGQKARINMLYPEGYSILKYPTTDKEKMLMGWYGEASSKKDPTNKLYPDLLENTMAKYTLLSLGIRIDFGALLGEGDIIGYPQPNYYALTREQLENRGKEIETKTNLKMLDVKKGEDILDTLARYCFDDLYSDVPGYSNIPDYAQKHVDDLAKAVLLYSENNPELNGGLYGQQIPGGEPVQGFSFVAGDPNEQTSNYFVAARDGQLFLPDREIEYKANEDSPAVVINPATCVQGSIANKAKEATEKPSGELQKCLSGNCYAVKKDDSLRKIYNQKCGKTDMGWSGFEYAVTDELVNPIIAKRITQKCGAVDCYPIRAGDVISLPITCTQNFAKSKKTSAPKTKKDYSKLFCPLSDDGCENGASYFLDGTLESVDKGGVSKLYDSTDKKEACNDFAKTLGSCLGKCKWRADTGLEGHCLYADKTVKEIRLMPLEGIGKDKTEKAVEALNNKAPGKVPSKVRGKTYSSLSGDFKPRFIILPTDEPYFKTTQKEAAEDLGSSEPELEAEPEAEPEPEPEPEPEAEAETPKQLVTFKQKETEDEWNRETKIVGYTFNPTRYTNDGQPNLNPELYKAYATIKSGDLICYYGSTIYSDEILKLQNLKGLKFSETFESKEKMLGTPALAAARVFFEPKIINFCKELIIDGELSYGSDWKPI